jgi:hypothetical protein
MMAGIERAYPRLQTRGPYAVRYPETPCIGAKFRRRRRRSAGVEAIMTIYWINLWVAISR